MILLVKTGTDGGAYLHVFRPGTPVSRPILVERPSDLDDRVCRLQGWVIHDVLDALEGVLVVVDVDGLVAVVLGDGEVVGIFRWDLFQPDAGEE